MVLYAGDTGLEVVESVVVSDKDVIPQCCQPTRTQRLNNQYSNVPLQGVSRLYMSHGLEFQSHVARTLRTLR